MELHIAQDLFVNDVRKIQSADSLTIINSHEFGWHNKESDIYWRFNNNRLERIEKNNTNTKNNKRMSIVVSNISDATFTIETGSSKTSIELLLTPAYDQNIVVRSYCTVRTGLRL